jgi:branched-chain amino acid transport system ATP-binding protein
MAMLEVEGIHTYYGHIHALRDVSVSVEEGEIVTIIGANGAGKSTMLKTTSGLLKPRKGSIRLNDEDLTKLRPHKIVEKGVVQVPEGRRIFGTLTVMENLDMGAFICKDSQKNTKNLERVLELFPRLKERGKQVAGTLSGGEQQMLAMGRALMTNPIVLLLDEPSMGLAPVLVDDRRNDHPAGRTERPVSTAGRQPRLCAAIGFGRAQRFLRKSGEKRNGPRSLSGRIKGLRILD